MDPKSQSPNSSSASQQGGQQGPPAPLLAWPSPSGLRVTPAAPTESATASAANGGTQDTPPAAAAPPIGSARSIVDRFAPDLRERCSDLFPLIHVMLKDLMTECAPKGPPPRGDDPVAVASEVDKLLTEAKACTSLANLAELEARVRAHTSARLAFAGMPPSKYRDEQLQAADATLADTQAALDRAKAKQPSVEQQQQCLRTELNKLSLIHI